MGSEEIEVKDQWDTVQAIRELTRLEEFVIRFMEHTLQKMSHPRIVLTPFGESYVNGEVEHPLGDLLGRIRAMREACYKQYGKEMWEQEPLFDLNNVTKDEDGRATEA